MLLSFDMGDAEQWRRVRDVLHGALELGPGERGAYLDQACRSDAALRAEVQALLEASEKPALIDHPVLASTAPTVTIESVEPPSLLKPGQMVSHYQIVEKIGEGGMGEVYKAIDKHLDRTVALKVVLDAGSSWNQKQRFAREAKAASALNHPNIVTVYEFNRADDIDFIAMEYIEGVTLGKLRDEPLPKLLGYARQAAGAFAKAHAAGILHRDLKPNNIMVTREGVVKILDFGLAKHQESPDTDATGSLTLTRTGAMVGTPAYTSPEQIQGEPVGPAADIFSFGIILYELAFGERPFKGKTALATMEQVAHYDPPVSSDSLPPPFTSLIRRCLKKSPAERPQCFDEVVQALESISFAPGDKVSSRRRWMIASTVGIVAVAAGVFVARRPTPPIPTLTYAIEAQKPGGEPYTASTLDTFEAGWKFRLRLHTPPSGFVYVVNEGPGQNGAEQFWVLYSGAVRSGDGTLTGWFVFDQNPGTERLWIAWAKQGRPEMDTTGPVENPANAAKIRDILGKLQADRGAPDQTAALATHLELKHQ